MAHLRTDLGELRHYIGGEFGHGKVDKLPQVAQDPGFENAIVLRVVWSNKGRRAAALVERHKVGDAPASEVQTPIERRHLVQHLLRLRCKCWCIGRQRRLHDRRDGGRWF